MTSVFFSVCFAIGALTSVYEDRPSIEYETVAKNSLAEVKAYRDKLIEIQRRVKSEFAARPDAYQAERIQKRHSMAVRCCDFVARNADKGDWKTLRRLSSLLRWNLSAGDSIRTIHR